MTGADLSPDFAAPKMQHTEVAHRAVVARVHGVTNATLLDSVEAQRLGVGALT